MKYLTIDYIKQHSRIDFGDDDELLKLYAESAETATLNYIGRSLEELKDMNGGTVPYTFDFLIRPYMKLT